MRPASLADEVKGIDRAHRSRARSILVVGVAILEPDLAGAGVHDPGSAFALLRRDGSLPVASQPGNQRDRDVCPGLAQGPRPPTGGAPFFADDRSPQFSRPTATHVLGATTSRFAELVRRTTSGGLALSCQRSSREGSRRQRSGGQRSGGQRTRSQWVSQGFASQRSASQRCVSQRTLMGPKRLHPVIRRVIRMHGANLSKQGGERRPSCSADLPRARRRVASVAENQLRSPPSKLPPSRRIRATMASCRAPGCSGCSPTVRSATFAAFS